MHGIVELSAGIKTKGSAVWLVALFLSCVAFSIQVGKVIKAFASEETGTRVEQWSPTKIPVLTICPANYLSVHKVMQNFQGISEVEAAYINSLMDAFLPFGSLGRSYMGAITMDEIKVVQEIYRGFADAALQTANRFEVWDRYNGMLGDYIVNNSWRQEDILESVRLAPLSARVKVSRHVHYYGLCFALEVEREFSRVQLQSLELKLVFKPWADESVLGVHVRGVVDSFMNKYAKYFRDMRNELFIMRIGGKNSKGSTTAHAAWLGRNREFHVNVIPNRLEILNLKRRPCSSYDERLGDTATESYHRCAFRLCDRCHVMFPDEQLSRNFSECNYLRAGQLCPMEILDKTTAQALVFSQQSCPPPCVEEDGTIAITTKSAAVQYHTTVKFTFRQTDQSRIKREYLLVTPEQVLSSIGGSMGFYFGASVVSVFYLMQFLIGLMLRCRKR